MAQKRILVVGLERALYAKIEPIFHRSPLGVDRVPKGESGILLTTQAAFDLIVVRYPLPDMAVGSFMTRAHQPGSLCAATPFLFLADPSQLEAVRSLMPGGRDQVLSVKEPAKFLQAVASRLLGAEPRTSARAQVRLTVQLETGQAVVTCETENISEKGMLVRSETLYPVGTRMSFEITLPGDRLSASGEAEVMRHSVPDVEGVNGVGLRFTSLKGDTGKRLRRFAAAK